MGYFATARTASRRRTTGTAPPSKRRRAQLGWPPSTRAYTWGLDLSRSPEGAGGIGGLLAVQQGYPEPDPMMGGPEPLTMGLMSGYGQLNYIYLYDGHGNVGQLLDLAPTTWNAAAVMVARYEYDPYGRVLSQLGTFANPDNNGNPFQFSTKYYDHEVGLNYFGYRYYSPRLGRWINRDPIEDEGGANLVRYVRNAPTNAVDPLGLCPIPEPGDVIWGSIGMNPSEKYFKWNNELAVEMSATGRLSARMPHTSCPLVGIVQIARETYDGKTPGKWVLDTGMSNTPLYPHGTPFPPAATRFFELRDQPGWNPWTSTTKHSFKHEFETCVVCFCGKNYSWWKPGCTLGCVVWGYKYTTNSAPPARSQHQDVGNGLRASVGPAKMGRWLRPTHSVAQLPERTGDTTIRDSGGVS